MPHTAVDVLECDDTDEALAQRVRRGDSDAFEELYRRHRGVATSMARRFLGSHQDAEDAVSDAFTNVFSALRRQAGPRELFRPYLLVCVRNSCLQRIRRSKQAWSTHSCCEAEQPGKRFVSCDHYGSGCAVTS